MRYVNMSRDDYVYAMNDALLTYPMYEYGDEIGGVPWP